MFKIEGGKLTLTAADNETMLTTILDLVEADGEFTFAVNAKVIQDAMKEIPEQPVDFYVNTDTFAITIDYMNGQYNIVGQDASEYPLTSGLGEDVIQYIEPVLYSLANISPATGMSNTEQFGNLDNYDKVIVTSDLGCPIDENSVLWIDEPDTTKPYNYIVKRVSKSKNGVSIAVAKVQVMNSNG